MPYFVVTRDAGPGWDPGKPMRGQPDWDEHAAFMDALADEGFILFGGPLTETGKPRHRAMMVVEAPSEAELLRRFDDDVWTGTGVLTTRVESWELLLGAARLESL
jgi:uncharacterized protein YciI